MRTTLLLTIIGAMFAAGAAYGQTQSLAFNDGDVNPTSGTYLQNDTFSFDVSLTFNGYSATALDFWLEATTGFAGSLSITGVTYGTAFPSPNETTPNPAPFNVATGASAGFMTEARNLGSSPNFPNTVPQGTYLVAHVTFVIQAAAPGNYILKSTVTFPQRASQVSDSMFTDHPLLATQYMITIIPEPTTLALVGLTALGGVVMARCRRVLRG